MVTRQSEVVIRAGDGQACDDDFTIGLQSDRGAPVTVLKKIGNDDAVRAEIAVQRTVGEITGEHEIERSEGIGMSRDDDFAVGLNGYRSDVVARAEFGRLFSGDTETAVRRTVGELAHQRKIEGGSVERPACGHDAAVGLQRHCNRLIISAADVGGQFACRAESEIGRAIGGEPRQGEIMGRAHFRPARHDDAAVGLQHRRVGKVVLCADRCEYFAAVAESCIQSARLC